MTFHDKKETFEIDIEKEKADWLLKTLENISLYNDKKATFSMLKSDFENSFDDFELFWYSKPINILRNFGLLVFS